MARPKHPERCGNRTTGPERRTKGTQIIKEAMTGASLITEEAKKLAAARRAASPVSMEQMPTILQAWADYVKDCENNRRPMTWGGFALAGGISVDTMYRMRNGDLDHIVEEYRITHNLPEDAKEAITEDGEVIPLLSWSEPCQKLEALIQDQLERNCYTNKGNPAGSIFGLKARFDWQDQPEAAQNVTNNLVIADAEQAKKAMKLLENVEK